MLNRLKNEVWLEYMKRYKLDSIAVTQKILSGKSLQSHSTKDLRAHRGSHNERTATKALDGQERVEMLGAELNALQKQNVSCFLGELCHEYTFRGKDFIFNEFESLCLGKPVLKLCSSKFLEINFLKFFHKVIEYRREKCPPPTDEVQLEYFRIDTKIVYQLNVRVDVANYCQLRNYNRFEKNLVRTILTSLRKNHDIHTMSICSLPILTHFLVCFVYFLANLIFDKIHFVSTSNEIVFVKMTRNRKIVDGSIDKLLALLQRFDDESEKVTLLGFFDIQKLYEPVFYDRIKFFNKMLCFTYCTEYLD